MSTRITLKIKGMECPNCAMRLESLEGKLPGVTCAEASYRKAQLMLEYDEARLSEAQIRTEIQRLGYEVGS